MSVDRRPAIEAFVASEYPRVVGVVSLLVGDQHRAEEAVQEAIIKAWAAPDELRNLSAWVIKVALNEVRGAARRSKAEDRAIGRLSTFLPPSHPGPLPDRVAVAGALDALPVLQREVAVLYYYLDLSVDGVAESLGVSAGTVKTSLFRARAALGRALGAADGDADDPAEGVTA